MLKLKLKTNFYGELCLKDCKENIWFLMTYFNMVFILQYYSLFFLSFSLLTRSLNSFQWVLKYAWPILALWLIRGCIWPYFVNKLTLWVTPNFFRGQNKIKTDSCRNICIASSITAGTRGCMIFFFLGCVNDVIDMCCMVVGTWRTCSLVPTLRWAVCVPLKADYWLGFTADGFLSRSYGLFQPDDDPGPFSSHKQSWHVASASRRQTQTFAFLRLHYRAHEAY